MQKSQITTIDSKTWEGSLSSENIEAVANAIFEKLNGKTYTFITVHEAYLFPTVRTGQKFHIDERNGKSPMKIHKSDKSAHFSFFDTYGVWGLDVERAGGPPQPYLRFGETDIKIVQANAKNERITWVIFVEQHGQ